MAMKGLQRGVTTNELVYKFRSPDEMSSEDSNDSFGYGGSPDLLPGGKIGRPSGKFTLAKLNPL